MSSDAVVARLDGTLVPADAPLLRPDDAGVVRGDGVFESTLAVDGEIRDLDEHLARLRVSAEMIELALPGPEAWRRGVDAVVAARPEGELAVRLTATRGPAGGPPTCFVTGTSLGADLLRQRRAGVRVLLLDRGFTATSSAGRPWLLAGAKTLSYAINMAALRYATSHDADDVIFVGGDGRVLEAPTATVVLAHGRILSTPPTDGILAGITVRRLFAAAEDSGWTTRTAPLTVDDLRAADGVWLTSGVRLLAAVTAVDGVSRAATESTAELSALLQVPGGVPAGT